MKMLSAKNYLSIKKKYGAHASWAIWADETDTPKSNMEDTSIFDNVDIHKQLNPNIVLVGLNISGYIFEK